MERNFIYEIPGNLSEKLCKEIIDSFEKDPSKRLGGVGPFCEVIPDIKKSTDLMISDLQTEKWRAIDKILCSKLRKGIREYYNYLINSYRDFKNNTSLFGFCDNMSDVGYQIQRTDEGGEYIWHNDFMLGESSSNSRHLTFIWYLNTIEDDQGGKTQFIDGTRIKPEMGKLIFFPSTWTCVHSGEILKYGKKYIVTGWLYA